MLKNIGNSQTHGKLEKKIKNCYYSHIAPLLAIIAANMSMTAFQTPDLLVILVIFFLNASNVDFE